MPEDDLNLVDQAKKVLTFFLDTLNWASEMRRFNLRPELAANHRDIYLGQANTRERDAEDALSSFVERLRKSDAPGKREAMELMVVTLKKRANLPLIPKSIVGHLERELNKPLYR